MLSDEEISSIARRYRIASDRLGAISLFARAIEAAVLPEGLVAVSVATLQKRRDDSYSCKLLCDDLLAAAPKPAQAEKQEPVKDEPVAWMVVTSYDKLIFQNASQAEHCAEKWELVSAPLYTRPQPEPVNDEPVAWIDGGDLREVCNGNSRYVHCDNQGRMVPLYTHPQPDLTAEVERLKLSAEHWNRLYREKCQEFHDAQANKGQEIVWLIDRIAELEALVSTREDDIRTEKMWVQRHAERIAELEAQDTEMCDVHAQLLVEHGKAKLHIAALEEAARQARDAFEQHDGNYKLSKASGAVVEAAIAKLDAVLGNAD